MVDFWRNILPSFIPVDSSSVTEVGVSFGEGALRSGGEICSQWKEIHVDYTSRPNGYEFFDFSYMLRS